MSHGGLPSVSCVTHYSFVRSFVPCLYDPNYGIAPGAALNMARPLRGLRVLDLGNFLAGPVVSMHLGAMGADVIKLERITGDDSRAIGPMAADGESSC